MDKICSTCIIDYNQGYIERDLISGRTMKLLTERFPDVSSPLVQNILINNTSVDDNIISSMNTSPADEISIENNVIRKSNNSIDESINSPTSMNYLQQLVMRYLLLSLMMIPIIISIENKQ